LAAPQPALRPLQKWAHETRRQRQCWGSAERQRASLVPQRQVRWVRRPAWLQYR
jgi:hypothetical protein